MSADLNQPRLNLLKEFKDDFAWTYAEASLVSQLITHQLNIRAETRSVKQALRNFKPDLMVQIKQESQKLDVGFKPIEYSTSLANIVHVKNTNGQILLLH